MVCELFLELLVRAELTTFWTQQNVIYYKDVMDIRLCTWTSPRKIILLVVSEFLIKEGDSRRIIHYYYVKLLNSYEAKMYNFSDKICIMNLSFEISWKRQCFTVIHARIFKNKFFSTTNNITKFQLKSASYTNLTK